MEQPAGGHRPEGHGSSTARKSLLVARRAAAPVTRQPPDEPDEPADPYERLRPDADHRQPSWRRVALELPVLLLVALLGAWALKAHVAEAYHIPSGSMEPQLEVGDRVVVSRLAYRLHEPRRGDIIVFDAPAADADGGGGVGHVVGEILEGVGLREPDETELIKRVIALEGEVIEARNGRVLIDGRELVEPYLPDDVVTDDFGPETVPEGHVFVLGDNRGSSADSRSALGPVPVDRIVGRAVARVWPPTRWANL